MKSKYLRGEEELQESSFILYKYELFQIVVRHKIINKIFFYFFIFISTPELIFMKSNVHSRYIILCVVSCLGTGLSLFSVCCLALGLRFSFMEGDVW